MSIKIDDESADVSSAALDSLLPWAKVRGTTTYSPDAFEDAAWASMSTSFGIVYLSEWQQIDLMGATHVGPRPDASAHWKLRVGVMLWAGVDARRRRDYRAAKRLTELAVRAVPNGAVPQMRQYMAADAYRDGRLLARKERRARINRRGWA
jgi:hypothetical protein